MINVPRLQENTESSDKVKPRLQEESLRKPSALSSSGFSSIAGEKPAEGRNQEAKPAEMTSQTTITAGVS